MEVWVVPLGSPHIVILRIAGGGELRSLAAATRRSFNRFASDRFGPFSIVAIKDLQASRALGSLGMGTRANRSIRSSADSEWLPLFARRSDSSGTSTRSRS